MNEFDKRNIVALLADTDDGPTEAVQAVQFHGLSALLTGRPADTQMISERSQLPIVEIEQGISALIDAGRIELDGDQVIGVGGLTMSYTQHSVSLPEAEMHTWCALDAVGIPAALGLAASVVTTCPYCEEQISLEIAAGQAAADPSIVLFCPTGPCSNVRSDFCSAANLFCDAAHLASWRVSSPAVAGNLLNLADTVDLGRAMWGWHRQRSEGAPPDD